MNADEMQTGAKMDAIIDKMCGGFEWRISPYIIINGTRYDTPTWLRDCESPEDPLGGSYPGQSPPTYSTKIEIAWRIIEQLPGKWELRRTILHTQWRAFYQPRDTASSGFEATAKTAPLAICRVALKAVGE